MSCTTPQVPSYNAKEAAEFAKKFAEETSDFIKALELPSAFEPSVLAFTSKTSGYYVDELKDPEIVQPYIENAVINAIKVQPSISVDVSVIVKDLTNIFSAFVAGAKATPVFSGFSTTSYRGKYAEQDALYKVLLTVHTANATELYESQPREVLEVAYSAYLTVQRAD